MKNQNDPYVIGSPFTRVQGDSYPYVVTYPGASVIASPTCAIYQKGSDTDMVATLLSGSASTNGTTTVTTPIVQALAGGESYLLKITATVDGRTDVKLMELKCLFPWGE
jgi:hypothetical protein